MFGSILLNYKKMDSRRLPHYDQLVFLVSRSSGFLQENKGKKGGRFKLSAYLEKRPRDLAFESYVFTFKTLV